MILQFNFSVMMVGGCPRNRQNRTWNRPNRTRGGHLLDQQERKTGVQGEESRTSQQPKQSTIGEEVDSCNEPRFNGSWMMIGVHVSCMRKVDA